MLSEKESASCGVRKPSLPQAQSGKRRWFSCTTLSTIARLPSGSPTSHSGAFRDGVLGLRNRYCPPLHGRVGGIEALNQMACIGERMSGVAGRFHRIMQTRHPFGSLAPEAIGISLRTVDELHAMLERRNRHGVYSENAEKLLQKALRLALLVIGRPPAFREHRCRLAYFIPRFHLSSLCLAAYFTKSNRRKPRLTSSPPDLPDTI